MHVTSRGKKNQIAAEKWHLKVQQYDMRNDLDGDSKCMQKLHSMTSLYGTTSHQQSVAMKFPYYSMNHKQLSIILQLIII